MALTLLIVGAVGHVVLWVALINRAHALGLPRRWVNLLTLLCLAALAVAPLAVLAALFYQFGPETTLTRLAATAAWTYILLCAGVCVVSILQRWYLSRHPERDATLLANHTSQLSLDNTTEPLTAPGIPTWLSRLPGNQVLKICTQEKEISLPHLAAAHDGLRIAHLTDLHMSGRLTRAFFEQVVDQVNRAEVDLVAVTGDIVEGNEFLDWLPSTLGRLKSRYGVYYVLGNHDRRADETRLRAALSDAGLISVGRTWIQIFPNGSPLILAGNELPWYKPAADLRNCPQGIGSDRPTRVLLAHSPDQFKWAQRHDFDLMLAGHLHGGQVRLPLLGAITSPSMHGVRYAAGLFTAGSTVMHVSRGIGALTPLRYSCPPEIAMLILKSFRVHG
jgi:predicted MPP superfamily phosphohydrolase